MISDREYWTLAIALLVELFLACALLVWSIVRAARGSPPVCIGRPFEREKKWVQCIVLLFVGGLTVGWFSFFSYGSAAFWRWVPFTVVVTVLGVARLFIGGATPHERVILAVAERRRGLGGRRAEGPKDELKKLRRVATTILLLMFVALNVWLWTLLLRMPTGPLWSRMSGAATASVIIALWFLVTYRHLALTARRRRLRIDVREGRSSCVRVVPLQALNDSPGRPVEGARVEERAAPADADNTHAEVWYSRGDGSLLERIRVPYRLAWKRARLSANIRCTKEGYIPVEDQIDIELRRKVQETVLVLMTPVVSENSCAPT